MTEPVLSVAAMPALPHAFSDAEARSGLPCRFLPFHALPCLPCQFALLLFPPDFSPPSRFLNAVCRHAVSSSSLFSFLWETEKAKGREGIWREERERRGERDKKKEEGALESREGGGREAWFLPLHLHLPLHPLHPDPIHRPPAGIWHRRQAYEEQESCHFPVTFPSSHIHSPAGRQLL